MRPGIVEKESVYIGKCHQQLTTMWHRAWSSHLFPDSHRSSSFYSTGIQRTAFSCLSAKLDDVLLLDSDSFGRQVFLRARASNRQTVSNRVDDTTRWPNTKNQKPKTKTKSTMTKSKTCVKNVRTGAATQRSAERECVSLLVVSAETTRVSTNCLGVPAKMSWPDVVNKSMKIKRQATVTFLPADPVADANALASNRRLLCLLVLIIDEIRDKNTNNLKTSNRH